MADKSQLRLCPTRMASGGRIFLKSFWTSSRRVVTSSSISGVIPEYLSMIGYHKKKKRIQEDCMNYPSPCEIVPDGIGGFDQLVVNYREG